MIRPDTYVFRTLAAMARQRRELSGVRCGAVAEFLHAGFIVHGALQRQLEQTGLTDLKFAILVALYALDPNPASATDLAYYTGFPRSTVNGGIADLVERRLLATGREPADRRQLHYRLTAEGRRTGEHAALAYLHSVGLVARALPPPALAALQHASSRLAEGAARLSSASA